MKIFITGCNKSGTTLMLRMFHAFENTRVITSEVTIDRICEVNFKEKILVGKRKPKTIFSDIISTQELNRQKRLIKKHKLVIINCIRNGEDVIASNQHIERYVRAMKQAEKYYDIIKLTVRYEEIIKCPDLIQKVIEDIIKIKSKVKFSDYPKFVPKRPYKDSTFNNLRPLNTNRIDKPKGEYKILFNEFEKLINNY